MNFNIHVSTVFGLESVVKKECENLGFQKIKTSNGKVEFEGDLRDIAKANLWLRSAERVYIKLAEFEALSYDDIFENVKKIAWEDIIPENGKILVSGKSVKSKMYSISDNQRITKKAIIDRLSREYEKNWFDESEEDYKITISILNDLATVLLDTSGSGLHKRGYRTDQTKAPMKETLAAALLQIAKWSGDRDFVDLFCGSGTLPIEAALIAKNIAPGIQRDFDFLHWQFFDKKVFKEEKTKAYGQIKEINHKIMGFDIDPKAIETSKKNAINAGVDEDIEFVTKDVAKVGLLNNFGMVVSNPPYGERIGEEEDLKHIYKALGQMQNKLTTWSWFFITSDKKFERQVDRKADKTRKLFNGRIEVDYYQYFGPKPLNLLLEDLNLL